MNKVSIGVGGGLLGRVTLSVYWMCYVDIVSYLGVIFVTAPNIDPV